MTYKPILSVLPILCFLTSSLSAYNLMMGTIQFPMSLKSIPQVRMYHSGKIVKGKVDKTNNSITYSIPKYNNSQIRYNLVITESIEFASPKLSKSGESTTNIVEYIKIPDGKEYKLYTLLSIPSFSDDPSAQGAYQWRILNDRVRINNKIPDDALIVLFNPEWIESVESTNGAELPVIKIKKISEPLLHEKSAELLLAAIDSDTIHDASADERIKQKNNRIMIAAPVA